LEGVLHPCGIAAKSIRRYNKRPDKSTLQGLIAKAARKRCARRVFFAVIGLVVQEDGQLPIFFLLTEK
jgi:hypothetical protein